MAHRPASRQEVHLPQCQVGNVEDGPEDPVHAKLAPGPATSHAEEHRKRGGGEHCQGESPEPHRGLGMDGEAPGQRQREQGRHRRREQGETRQPPPVPGGGQDRGPGGLARPAHVPAPSRSTAAAAVRPAHSAWASPRDSKTATSS